MPSALLTRKRRRIIADINVVPYIDVMLVLLVIFMVVAPMVNPGIVDLPTVGSAVVQQQPPVVVTLAADASLMVKISSSTENVERKLGQAELVDFLHQRQSVVPDQPVVIAADKSVQYDAVMKLMAALKEIGIKRVGLLVKSS